MIYQDRLDTSAWTVTALFAVYAVGLLPALLWGGPASDVVGRRRLTLVGLIASAATSLLFIVGASSLITLYLARLVAGVASGVSFVVLSAWLSELAPAEERTWVARLTGMVLYAGFGIGPLLSGVMGEWVAHPLVAPYLIHLLVVVLGMSAIRGVPETVTAPNRTKISADFGLTPDTRAPFRRVVAPVAFGVFGFASLSFGLFPVLLRGAMSGIAVFITGLIGALTALAIFATQGISARLGPLRSVRVAFTSGTVGCALGAVAFATDWWGLLFPAALALGGASGLAVTSGLTFVTRLAEPHRRGAMTGSFYAVAYAGLTMPVIVSTLAGPGGYGVILTAITVVAALGTIVLQRSVRRFPELAGDS